MRTDSNMSRIRTNNRECAELKEGTLMTFSDTDTHGMSKNLHMLYTPQMEQLNFKLQSEGDVLVGQAHNNSCDGQIWISHVGRNCLITHYSITPAYDFNLTEISICDYVCACLFNKATVPYMIDKIYQPHSLLVDNAFSFLQPAGNINAWLQSGLTYESLNISLLPDYFLELERSWPGEYMKLFDEFSRPWKGEAAQTILDTLRTLRPLNGPGSGLLIESQINRMIAVLAATQTEQERAKNAHGSTQTSKLVHKVLSFVEKHLAEDLTLGRIAESLYVGRTQLCSVFRAETSTGLADYIRRRRIEIACDLLATTNASISEVARRVGYPRSTSFSTTFAHETGISPTQWRTRHGAPQLQINLFANSISSDVVPGTHYATT